MLDYPSTQKCNFIIVSFKKVIIKLNEHNCFEPKVYERV